MLYSDTVSPASSHTTGRRHRNRRGVTTLEFAAVFPVLFILFIGAVQLFRFTMAAHAIETCTIEGAREGSLAGRTTDDAVAAASDLLISFGYNGGEFSAETLQVDGTNFIRVEGSIPMSNNGFSIPGIGTSFRLTRDCSIRIEADNSSS